MQRWRGVEAAPAGWGRSVVTIGVYDGVHRGHQQTIGHTVARARDLGVASVVVTFDPHPSEVVRPGSHPAILTESARKAELIEALGVDVLCVIPFTLEFSHLSAETFVHDVLVEHLHAAVVVVGENFRFGHRAAGDVALLAQLGRTFGFIVEGAPLVSSGTDGDPAHALSPAEAAMSPVVSSTYIRSCVDAGDVAEAARALGRPHRLEGIVVRGDQRGRELGFPTANLLTAPYAAIPADGVYATYVRLGRAGGPAKARSSAGAGSAQPLKAAVSVGTNPTFKGRERRVEAFLLDFDGDLYGERLALDFVARLREQRRYDGIEPLIEQIGKDVEEARAVLIGR
jgi:riboflavin kinase/FMN adenylyltransferase